MTRTPKRAMAKLFDLAAATPQLVLYAAAIAGTVLRLDTQVRALQKSAQLATYLAGLSQISNALYLSLLMALLVTRRLPVGSARGILPKLAALVGFSFTGLLILLSPSQISLSVRILSLSLTLGSAAVSIYVASYLGRSFSIFPQARGLVTSGPYRFIRHPLYLAESVAALGMSLQFAQPWSLIVAVASIAAQVPRMHYEEQILASVYPDYQAYMRRTSRLIPGVY